MLVIIKNSFFLRCPDASQMLYHQNLHLHASPEPQEIPEWVAEAEVYKEALKRGTVLEIKVASAETKPQADPVTEKPSASDASDSKHQSKADAKADAEAKAQEACDAEEEADELVDEDQAAADAQKKQKSA